MNGVDLVALIAFLGTLTGIVGIIARAVVRYQDRRLRGRGDAEDPALRAELGELRAQLAEQQDMRQRLLELEERMDFAERVLASAKREQLGAGGEVER